MNKLTRIFLIAVLFILLILVRAFASNLFYDPFIDYFKNDYLHQKIPEFNTFKLFLNITFRFVLNTLISLGIIYLFFINKEYLKFTIQFYSIAFVILSVLFFILLKTEITTSYLPIFMCEDF